MLAMASRLKCRGSWAALKASSAAARAARTWRQLCVSRASWMKTLLLCSSVCDTGEHYLTKHHSDEWLKSKRLLEPQRMTAGLISGTKAVNAPQSLVSVAPPDKLSEALAKMNELGLTQIPVLEEGRPVGSLRENRVLSKVVRDRHLLEAPVSEVMEPSFPTGGCRRQRSGSDAATAE